MKHRPTMAFPAVSSTCKYPASRRERMHSSGHMPSQLTAEPALLFMGHRLFYTTATGLTSVGGDTVGLCYRSWFHDIELELVAEGSEHGEMLEPSASRHSSASIAMLSGSNLELPHAAMILT